MSKQYVEGVQKWKKAHLMMDCKMVIASMAFLFNGRIRDNACAVKRTTTKGDREWFSVTVM